MKPLTVGSLFSGIGGIELGLERAGMKPLWQVECDDYARKVLKKHWPDVWRPHDVRLVHAASRCEIAAWPCSHCLGPADVICGGFPCQDVSVAGNGAGLAGARSGLWREFARIIGELRPRFVVIENVPALRSRGLAQVLFDLAALGFDAEWDCLPAVAFGAPHQRDRIFIVAHAHGVGDEFERVTRRLSKAKGEVGGHVSQWRATYGGREVVSNTNGERREKQSGPRAIRAEVSDAQRSSEALADAAGERRLEGLPESETRRRTIFSGDCRIEQSEHWAIEPEVGRVAHGVSRRVDRLRCLGNAVVPVVAEFIGRRIIMSLEAA